MNDLAAGHQPPSTVAKIGPSATKGLMVVGAIAVVVVAFLLLTRALGIAEFWAGFLFLFFWAGIEQMRFERLNFAVVGACVGLLAALALNQLPQLLGGGGLALALAGVVALVYCQVMGWLALLVNNATMLFLTVATIPHLQASGNFPQMFAGLLVGVVFFGGLLWSAFRVARWRAARKA
ncbi:MAG: hypothetical protein WDA10_06635 [Porticoccaceae bacterium]|nr:hypothetical protein [Porticoccaceae bacterium]